MMPRGRLPRRDPSVEWKLHIPKSVADAINERIIDPLTGKPEFGKRSKLTTMLYRQWLEDN